MANLIISQPPTTIVTLLLVALFAITPTIESLCSDLMATSLSSSGFKIFAHALQAHNLTTTTATASTTCLTFLAPPDTALINRFFNNDTLHGHITSAGALGYQSLLTLPHNTTLPTLHHNTTLLVGIDGQKVSFNDVLVIVPNLYIDGSCAVHGVDGPLVPIPSPVEGSVKPRTDAARAPLARRRSQASRVFKYVRFIRRAIRPNLGDEASDANHP